MKNIWKLLMIVAMTIAIVGCPQNGGDDGNTDNNNGNEDMGIEAAVYTYTAPLSSTSTAWTGGSPSPTFSIMLMDEYAIKFIQEGKANVETDPSKPWNNDLKKLPASSPAYQIQAYGDNRFPKTAGTWNVYGVTAGKNYSGVVVKVTNDSYTLYIDTSKIKKTDLKGIGQAWKDNGGEKVMTADDEVDLTGFIPVTLALSDTTDDAKGYVQDLWSARLVKLTKEDDVSVFPSNAQDVPNITPKNVTDINDIRGSLPGINLDEHKIGYLDANGEYKFSTSDLAADATADYEFKLVVAATAWDWKVGAQANFGTFNNKVAEAQGSFGNDTNFKVTLAGQKNYTLNFNKNNSKVTITETGDYEAPATHDITITEVDAADGEVSISGDTDGKAAEGTEITISATPGTGKKVGTISVKDAGDVDVTVTENKFTMPAKAVTITVTFIDA